MTGYEVNMFSGMRVITSPYLEQDGEPYPVRRTWRERLFSRPWRPFQATRFAVPKIPNPGAIHLNATTLVMHPDTLKRLRDQLAAGLSPDPKADRER